MAARLRRGAHIALDESRLVDDLGQAIDDGCTLIRFDLPWAIVQRSPGNVDGATVELARRAAQMISDAGAQPWVRLLQRDVPTWFDNDGGFADQRTAAMAWPRWVETAAEAIGDVVAGWVPFEAPWAMTVRLAPGDARRQGEIAAHLLVAWRDAWRVLGGGGPLVATSIDVAVVRPSDPADQRSIDAAGREDHLRWDTWMSALSRGVVDVPGRAVGTLADLAGACDVLGIAATTQIETVLHRAAEMGPPRPLALTYRAPLGSVAERREQVATGLAETERVAEELDITSVTVLA